MRGSLQKEEKTVQKLVAFCSFGKTKKVLFEKAGIGQGRMRLSKKYKTKMTTLLTAKGILKNSGGFTERGMNVLNRMKQEPN